MSSTTTRSRMTVAIAALLGALILAGPVMAASSLAVQSSAVNGAIVQVTVKNFSMSPKTGTVAVQAVVNGVTLWSIAPVVVAGGQSVSVSAAFTAKPSKLLSVGVTDENTPY